MATALLFAAAALTVDAQAYDTNGAVVQTFERSRVPVFPVA
jgi:hypothetical protein